MFEATFLCTLLHFMFTLLSGRYVTSLQPFSSLVGGQRAQEMVLNWQRFGASTRPQHVCLMTKTSILVWSWSHSVRTLMRNMWSCPDTLSEETQSFTPSFSPPSPYSPILSFSLSFPHFPHSVTKPGVFSTSFRLLKCQIFIVFFLRG